MAIGCCQVQRRALLGTAAQRVQGHVGRQEQLGNRFVVALLTWKAL